MPATQHEGRCRRVPRLLPSATPASKCHTCHTHTRPPARTHARTPTHTHNRGVHGANGDPSAPPEKTQKVDVAKCHACQPQLCVSKLCVCVRGRRGIWKHRRAFCVAGVALMALGWLWWCAWVPLAPWTWLFVWELCVCE